jgi:uncharacterized membrane protein
MKGAAMKIRKSEIFYLAMIAVFIIVGFVFYPQMPDKIASHWNAQGEVDGYMSKFWGVFLLPIIVAAITTLFIAIPRIDPLKQNIKKFIKYYDGFIIIFLLFMLFIEIFMLLWNSGTKLNINRIIPFAVGLLFIYAGILIENAKQNWFVGIRTPWTLSSETVWNKTHKLGSKLFIIAGIISMIGVFFGNLAFYFIIIPIIGVSIYTIAYSYFEYQKERNK